MKNTFATLSLVAAASLLGASASQAATTFYTSSSAWNHAVGQSSTDSLDDLADSAGQLADTPLDRSTPDYGYGYSFYAYSLTRGAPDPVWIAGSGGNGFMGVPSAGDVLILDHITGSPTAFSINLFGVDGADSFMNYPVTLEVLDAKGRDVLYTIDPGSMTAGSFIGITSDAAIVTINVYPDWPSGASGSPRISLDNVAFAMTSAAPVPEPASGALLLLGGLAVAGRVRRRAAR
ncbi:PEP-CTERM sorting domain-containing protein [Paucibacter sp. R3-3]|uniref:PEP-CTERM sorting domain-containing protein n=1 Tax=Roseateles agri TaxID=3098619 RepID=A0ABU5DER8_9BURK|nr:PEP-CTERM sorting domain-containing protein [Paucibacter sp. R3-3]MDY0744639.1 PEP-CTERM sorting domain-containing protein [Paucibacter sp. R3-3]